MPLAPPYIRTWSGSRNASRARSQERAESPRPTLHDSSSTVTSRAESPLVGDDSFGSPPPPFRSLDNLEDATDQTPQRPDLRLEGVAEGVAELAAEWSQSAAVWSQQLKEAVDSSASSAVEWTQQLKEAADSTLNAITSQNMSTNQLQARVNQLEAELKAASADCFATRLQYHHEQAVAQTAVAAVAALETKHEQLVAARDAAVLHVEQKRATTEGVVTKLEADVRKAVAERDAALDEAQLMKVHVTTVTPPVSHFPTTRLFLPYGAHLVLSPGNGNNSSLAHRFARSLKLRNSGR